MIAKEHLVKEIETLNEQQLHAVGEYVAFLKFRLRSTPSPSFDEQQVAELYREFAVEDQRLAKEGLADYALGLTKEDTR